MGGTRIGVGLQRFRQSREPKVTQRTLGAALRVNPITISRWERGEVSPPTRQLERIAAYYGLTYFELLRAIEVFGAHIPKTNQRHTNSTASSNNRKDSAA